MVMKREMNVRNDNITEHVNSFNYLGYIITVEQAVAQLVEALCYKPEGSIPDEVIGFFN
jgi:hypothetical protein